VEHILSQWFDSRNYHLSDKQITQLASYAGLIHEANQNFNITGFKTLPEIIEILILGSIEPHLGLIVPRGTRFVDMGTGGGVPGVPLSIVFPHMSGVLMDSNSKRIGFIDMVVDTLGIDAIQCVCGRLEELAHDVNYRETFDYAFSRALADPYIALELGASLIKTGGFLYVYSSIDSALKHVNYQPHANTLGLQRISECEVNIKHWSMEDLVWEKHVQINARYPRRYPVMKREAERYMKSGTNNS